MSRLINGHSELDSDIYLEEEIERMKQKEKKGYQYRRNIPVENYDIESEMFESNNSFNMDIMNNPDKLLGMIYEPMKH